MPRKSSYQSMSADDLRAARLLTLAVKFFGTSHPISSSTIASELYPSLDSASFRRQFLRDRDLLAAFGLVIHEVPSDDDYSLWTVDEDASYVSDEELDATDARMLYILCRDLCFDQAFPYRDELRMALAKIARMYRGSTVTRNDTTTPAQHKLLSTLVTAMSARRAVRISYTDARGNASTRTIAIYGSFGLRNRSYFVASRVGADGTIEDDSIRTYRLDRISKAKELPSLTYRVPLDFSVEDYKKLPFQIGETVGRATLLVPNEASHELERAMAAYGCLSQSHDGQRTWTVSYSSERLMASWAITMDLMPLAPASLRECRDSILEASVRTPAHEPQLADELADVEAPLSRVRAGRVGSVLVARQLIALASSLTEEGEVISAEDIATTLGISYDDARHLIMLVSLGSGESTDYLPVIPGERDEQVELMQGAAQGARRVRLTRAETMALSAALAELGVEPTDPLSHTLASSYASPAFTAEDIARSIEQPSSSKDTQTLRTCSLAITQGQALIFSYRPVTGGPHSSRRVMPQMVRRGDEGWYLDAYDLVRGANRVFRIDRMDDVEPIKAPARPRSVAARQRQKLVLASFQDPTYLELFAWDGMETLGTANGATLVRMPWYGGSWLARHLAACGGTVRVGDETLAAEVHDFACRQLGRDA